MRPNRISTFLFLLAIGLDGPGPASAEESAEKPGESPAEVLVLREALALALTRNPELAAHTWEVRAREGVHLQAGLPPNPEAHLELEDVAGSGDFRGARRAQTTLWLSQLVELGGKRPARVEASGRGIDLATREYDHKRIQVMAEVTERFIHVLGDQHVLDLQREATRLAEATLHSIERRVQAGRASSLEEKKARVDLARARIDEEHAEHELASARKRLAAAWDDPAPRFARVEGDLFTSAAVPPYDRIAERADASPEILRSRTEVAVRRAEIRQEEVRGIPDPSLSGGLRRLEEDDSHLFVFGFSIPLPAFDRNQGRAAEARARYRKAEEMLRAAHARIDAELFGLYQEVLHAATEMETMEREIIPLATEALQISRDGFEVGKLSLLELLDAQRTFLEAKNEHIRAASRYHRFVTRIERLIGGSL